MERSQVLSALQRQIIDVVPDYLLQSGQLQVLSLKMGTLRIAVANAAVAAKIRQLAPDMVAKLQNKGCEVSGIQVKVQVSFDRGNRTPPPRLLSKTAQDTITGFNQSLTDSPLKTVLERLAKNHL